jgi:hypothetical protein
MLLIRIFLRMLGGFSDTILIISLLRYLFLCQLIIVPSQESLSSCVYAIPTFSTYLRKTPSHRSTQQRSFQDTQ